MRLLFIATTLAAFAIQQPVQGNGGVSGSSRCRAANSLRGGAAVASASAREAEQGYLLRQLQMRQQRLGILSQALREAGVESPDVSQRKKNAGPVPKEWDCTTGGEDPGTPCLIMGEVSRGPRARLIASPVSSHPALYMSTPPCIVTRPFFAYRSPRGGRRWRPRRPTSG